MQQRNESTGESRLVEPQKENCGVRDTLLLRCSRVELELLPIRGERQVCRLLHGIAGCVNLLSFFDERNIWHRALCTRKFQQAHPMLHKKSKIKQATPPRGESRRTQYQKRKVRGPPHVALAISQDRTEKRPGPCRSSRERRAEVCRPLHSITGRYHFHRDVILSKFQLTLICVTISS